MCLILLARHVRDDVPLVLAANRDEFHARPTAPAAFWSEPSGMLAGRDLLAGGTWLGVTRSGRLAAVTNIREPSRHVPGKRSRGALTVDYLGGDFSPEAYLADLAPSADAFNGFNLLTGTPDALWYGTNRDDRGHRALGPGFHGLSNSVLDESWHKVRSGIAEMETVLDRPAVSIPDLFAILESEERAADDALPDTGVGLERERLLSARFIRMPGYGTRSSTVVVFHRDAHVTFVERTWPATGSLPETRKYRFRIESVTPT